MEIMDKCLQVNPDAIHAHEKDGKAEPIHLAIYKNRDMKIIKYLFEKGAKINTENLCYALEYNKPMVVKYLFENGSKITEENAGKILRVAVDSYKGNNIMEIMDKCLQANPDAIHEKFGTNEAIHVALRENRDIKIVQYL
eukprot:147267_1